MIKVLVAPAEGLGFTGVSHVTGDFTWTEPGELVFDVGCPCPSPDCERAFIGARSRKGTTRAVVAEVDATEQDILTTSEDSMIQAWRDTPAIRQYGRDAADWVLREAARFEVGSVVIKDLERNELVPGSSLSVEASYEQVFRELGLQDDSRPEV